MLDYGDIHVIQITLVSVCIGGDNILVLWHTVLRMLGP